MLFKTIDFPKKSDEKVKKLGFEKWKNSENPEKLHWRKNGEKYSKLKYFLLKSIGKFFAFFPWLFEKLP